MGWYFPHTGVETQEDTMPHPPTDEVPLDLTQREQYEQERRSVVQPTLAEDDTALAPGVEPTPCPRHQSPEVVQQPWSQDESSRWRRAPR
jgi:hypothetical protein